jgi:zinc protease
MKITHQKIRNVVITNIIKADTPIVTVHITATLSVVQSVQEATARSLYCDVLLSGTDTMSREAFLDAVNEAGGSISIKEQEGRITITIETIAPRLSKILALTEHMLTRAHFARKEIIRASTLYRKQLVLAKEQARAMANLYLLRTLYSPNEPIYPYTPDEELIALSAITTATLRTLHQAVLRSFWSVTIGGSEKSIKQVHRFLSKVGVHTKDSVPNPHPSAINLQPQLVTHQISAQQNIELSIGQRVPLTLMAKEYPAFLFAMAVLGRWGGFAGRLMNVIREKEGLTYGIYCRSEGVDRFSYGHWRIMTFFHPKDLERGISSIHREIRLLCTRGITHTELTRFKTILDTSHVLLFDSLISLTNTVHSYQSKQLTYKDFEQLRTAMQALTKKDVDRVIKKYIHPELLSYSLAGNLTECSSQLQQLRKSLQI